MAVADIELNAVTALVSGTVSVLSDRHAQSIMNARHVAVRALKRGSSRHVRARADGEPASRKREPRFSAVYR